MIHIIELETLKIFYSVKRKNKQNKFNQKVSIEFILLNKDRTF
jgi:hypothetical protein